MNFLKFYYILSILSFSNMNYDEYTIQFSIDNDDLEPIYIRSSDYCQKWIPSLFSPILLMPKDGVTPGWKDIEDDIPINPIFLPDNFKIKVSNYMFLNKYDTILGKPMSAISLPCYFGLSTRLEGFNDMNIDYILLKHLKNTSQINETIFSFDKFSLVGNNMVSKLYFGDVHSNFISNQNEGIIGNCKTDKSDLYWGCLFDTISFNGKKEYLKNSTFEYKIYFSSENYDIIIPKMFETQFDNLTDNKCNLTGGHSEFGGNYLQCDIFFNESQDYTLLELNNEDMDITIEIDKYLRFTSGNYSQNKTRIKYENIDYFIFPLIMFKNFHIQFDDKNDLISFYTNDSSILKVKKKENKKKDKGSSKGLTAFIVIIIILGVIALLYGIFWFLKKRKESVEKSINKYNRFEDEDIQDLKENRVF